MPSCAAINCTNRRTGGCGVTFHMFPKDPAKKRAWELAVSRKDFHASKHSAICSDHFKPEDFDRTGQTVRLRDNVIPSIFSFSSRRKNQPVGRKRNPRKVYEYKSCPAEVPSIQAENNTLDNRVPTSAEHDYAVASPKNVQNEKLTQRSPKKRTYIKKTLGFVISQLEKQNLITQDFKQRLDKYSDIPLELLTKDDNLPLNSRQGEFALTVYNHCPMAYCFLRDTMKFPLPHPHTLQRQITDIKTDNCDDQTLENEEMVNAAELCEVQIKTEIKEEPNFEECSDAPRGVEAADDAERMAEAVHQGEDVETGTVVAEEKAPASSVPSPSTQHQGSGLLASSATVSHDEEKFICLQKEKRKLELELLQESILAQKKIREANKLLQEEQAKYIYYTKKLEDLKQMNNSNA